MAADITRFSPMNPYLKLDKNVNLVYLALLEYAKLSPVMNSQAICVS